jgi:undecaprenyl-phosphate 4-deoxy-4-formamido-L-arabinose transferase
MSSDAAIHRISVVIPVYKGQKTLPGVVREIEDLGEVVTTDGGVQWSVDEVILVHDNGPDRSDETIRALAAEHRFVRPVWLSRNFGQHAATLAGIASSGSEWVVTLDEDGQHDPRQIGVLLSAALEAGAPLVYGKPRNDPPHGAFRNAASRGAKRVVSALSGQKAALDYQSFRLFTGEIGRSVAAYSGAGVYLDIALGWVAPRSVSAPIDLREEGDRPSGYSTRTLLSHFWRLMLSSGTRGLRLVSAMGVLFALAGVVFAIVAAVQRVGNGSLPEGWTSLIIAILITSGAILFALGVIAEYLGVAVSMAMGKPNYLIVDDPANGPLGRDRRAR